MSSTFDNARETTDFDIYQFDDSLEPVKKNDHNECYGLMEKYPKYTGLTNQIIYIINAIYIVNESDLSIKKIIIADFLDDYAEESYIPIEQILNIEEFQKLIPQTTKIITRQTIPKHKIQYIPIQMPGIRLDARVSQCFKKFKNVFQPQFMEVVYPHIDAIIADASKNNKNIHCIHLRNEEDAIKHWSAQNKMSKTEFETVLTEKYKFLIQQTSPPGSGDIFVVLSGLEPQQNKIVQWMLEQGYNVYQREKKRDWGRERNAILDLLLASTILEKISDKDGKFIGNMNPYDYGTRGSTFDLFIICLSSLYLKKYYYIDLDDISAKDYLCPEWVEKMYQKSITCANSESEV
jgi:hypothetical protein